MRIIRIHTPFTLDVRERLRASDEVLLTGMVLTARDAAHKRLAEMVRKGARVPLPLEDAVIYYCGPTPAAPGRVIGSCGPTTSSRMDPFTADLLKLGVTGMIGKGRRSDEVRRVIKKNKAVYFLATGGIGALLATKVKKAKPVLFRELGPEAVYKLEVADFPLIVGIDAKGGDVYR